MMMMMRSAVLNENKKILHVTFLYLISLSFPFSLLASSISSSPRRSNSPQPVGPKDRGLPEFNLPSPAVTTELFFVFVGVLVLSLFLYDAIVVFLDALVTFWEISCFLPL
jgi:hypothetical protein